MKKILILGKGGTGRELFSLLTQHYCVAGYLDDKKSDEDVIDKISEYESYQQDFYFAAALGSYKTMTQRSKILVNMPDANFPPLVSQKAHIYSEIAKQGLLVFPGSTLTCNLELGKHVFIYHNCVVSHDTRIGNYTMLSNSVTISGNCNIGERVYIGAGAVINEGINIGSDCIVASGATVINDVPDKTIYLSKDDVRSNGYI